MKTIKMSKTDLLDKIKENRDKHEALYLEAIEGYKDSLVKTLKKMLANAKANKEVEHFLTLEKPVNNLKDYDRAIAMLEVTIDTVIELDQNEFSNLFLDQWVWKDAFMATNSTYFNGHKR